ncbi:MAG TPA: FkbM family methyltransferase [Nitrososphaera sp.]
MMRSGLPLGLMAFRTYRNGFAVMRALVSGRRLEAVRRDGSKVTFHSDREIIFDMLSQRNRLHGKDFAVEFEGTTAIIDKRFRLVDAVHNGGIYPIFIRDCYRDLTVDGRIVIDIGANIADSCIYFVMRGAQKVVGFEPFPHNYDTAVRNVEDNGLAERINLVMAGCSGERGRITVDMGTSNTMSQAEDLRVGATVPIYDLAQIVSEHGGDVLKIDCEGCEYDAIIASSNTTLQNFQQIIIEFHHGYSELKRKLEDANFHVSYNVTGYWASRKMLTGHILATRQGPRQQIETITQ